jgi:UDP-N-acetylmuramoyl-tripeptide--D-alanyl-D-alanine ligase
VLKTDGNTNNHFGVPRNLLRLRDSHRAAVIEMGSNHPGEISSLVAMVKPEIGVVSNIGPAHLEFFGDLAGVAHEKGDLLAGTAWSGIAIYPSDAACAAVLRQKAGARRVITFGAQQDSDIVVRYLGPQGDHYQVRLDWRKADASVTYRWDCGGAHQALNAGAAAAVGTALGMRPELIGEGLADCSLPAMRMERRNIGGAVWINDAYNANPASMKAALDWFREAARAAGATTQVLVLGDMLELGAAAANAHRELLQRVATELPGAHVFTVGPCMAVAAKTCGFPNEAAASDVADAVRTLAQQGAWILLKGSRGVKLETILPDHD